ncbi:MAG: hypothetical protein ABIL39_06755 [candidate division WOR-3 bacterium]
MNSGRHRITMVWAVEIRNFTLVRSYVGYRRYDTDAEYEILRELMR